MCGSSTPPIARRSPVDGERVPGVGGVEPAVLEERGAQVAPRQLGAEDPVLGVEQIVRGVLRLRPVVVVAAPHHDAGLVEQAPERAQHLGHGAPVREVVAGVHHEVRLEFRETLDEPPLEALAGTQVQVTEVQHAQRPAGGGDGVEDLEAGPAQREPVPLDPDRVTQAEGAGGGHARGGAQRLPRDRRPAHPPPPVAPVFAPPARGGGPLGGVGGEGTVPLETCSVTTWSGRIEPRGFCPTTVPAGARLPTCVCATWKPASRSSSVASSAWSPTTSGTCSLPPPCR